MTFSSVQLAGIPLTFDNIKHSSMQPERLTVSATSEFLVFTRT